MANRYLFVAPLLALAIGAHTAAQTPQPVAQSWAGWAQCQITIQAPGYSHRETHLWTITGAGTRNANMEIYPTSWTVTGDGSLQRVNGPTTVSAQWTVNGTLPNVTIGTTLHLDRITVQRWTNHGPARSALTGTEISTTNGAARSRVIVLDVQQWAFPGVETGTTGTRATGSNTVPFDGLRGPMNPPSGAMGTAACSWDFARGGSQPTPPPTVLAQPVPTTPSSGAPVSGGSAPSAPGSPPGAGALVSVVSPNGGERLSGGDGAVIRMVKVRLGSAATQQAFDLDLSTDGGSTWTSQQRGVDARAIEGHFYLSLRLPPTSTSRALVRVTLTGRPETADVSDAPFTIVLGSLKLAPLATPLVAGQRVTISWTHDLPADQRRFRVRLVRLNVSESEQTLWLGEVNATGSSESFTFTVPQPATTQAQLTIITPGDLFAAFSPMFDIVAAGSPPPASSGGTGAVADLYTLVVGADPTQVAVVSWPANGTATYYADFRNNGPGAANGAVVRVPASAGLSKTTVECGALGGAQCPAGLTVSQLESGVAIPSWPPGGSITIRFLAAVSAAVGASVSVTGTASAPQGVTDPNPGNNSYNQTQSVVAAQMPMPAIATLTPSSALPGTRALAVSIAATGTHFVQGVSYVDFGELVGATSLTITSPTTANAIVNVDPAAPVGPRNITITTPSPDGTSEVVSRAAAFTVGSGPPPGGTPPSSGTTSASGRYRVTATSVYFRNAEADNPGPAIGDGKGDEIYLTSYAQVYDRRNGNQLSAGPLLRTPVHGDLGGAGGGVRVAAGSATPNGGIATGDEVQLRMSGASPVWLWEGELRDGIDVVVLRPVLWEFDGNEAAWYTVYAQRFPPTAPRQAFDLPVVQAAIPRAGVTFESVPGFTMTGAWVADTQDHPIGCVLNVTSSGQVAGTWTDRVLVLTRDKLEPWLTAAGGVGRVEMRVSGEIQVAAAGPGQTQNVRQDAVADYTLNVTIERRP